MGNTEIGGIGPYRNADRSIESVISDVRTFKAFILIAGLVIIVVHTAYVMSDWDSLADRSSHYADATLWAITISLIGDVIAVVIGLMMVFVSLRPSNQSIRSMMYPWLAWFGAYWIAWGASLLGVWIAYWLDSNIMMSWSWALTIVADVTYIAGGLFLILLGTKAFRLFR